MATPAAAVTFVDTMAPQNREALTRVAPKTITAPGGFGGVIPDEPAGVMATADSGIGMLDDVVDTGVLSGIPKGIGRPVAAAVPEPQAWALMILGLGAAGTLLRRRRQAQFSPL